MAVPKVIKSTAQFIDAINSPQQMLGLLNSPVTPWYFGQPEPDANLTPAFYKLKIKVELERELLREFRLLTAEFASLKAVYDSDVLIAASQATVPSRIIDWLGNPLAALFLAVESLLTAKNGKVWILNPWAMNELCNDLPYVPATDSEYFEKYVVNLTDPSLSPTPEALQPMAFRPYRNLRPQNTQNVYFTVHGKNLTPLNEIKFFMKKSSEFLTCVMIEGDRKKFIMKELHNLGVNRANLFPGMPSTVRTMLYRYSDDYLKTAL
ncbi:MAG: FRG domain-containing protein [Hyphomicrobiales bacterium]|nr:FRG domain-containing protein [Hyphomicrobiales bacterium]